MSWQKSQLPLRATKSQLISQALHRYSMQLSPRQFDEVGIATVSLRIRSEHDWLAVDVC